MILTPAGDEGIDMPDGDSCTLASTDANPANGKQREARILRVNSVGTRLIQRIDWGTFMSRHTDTIREEKELWEKFLLTPDLTLYESYELWLQINALIAKRTLINRSTDVSYRGLEENFMEIVALLDKIKGDTNLREIQNKIHTIIPTLSSPAPNLEPESLDPAQYFVLPVPASWNAQMVQKLGSYLKKRPGDQRIEAMVKDLRGKPSLIDGIRKGGAQRVEDTEAFNRVMVNMAELLEEAKKANEIQAPLRWYLFHENTRRYYLVREGDPGAENPLRLYGKMRGNRMHYDILL